MASESLFLLLELNLAACAAILAVLALRGAIRNWFGARVAYALWLLVPAAVAAALLPAREIVVDGVASAAAVVAQAAMAKDGLAAPLPIDARLDPPLLIMAAWIAGAVLALAVLAWRQAAFIGSLGRLRREAKDILRSDASGIGPAIIGAIRPKLILPADFEARFDALERDMVLTHERVHLRGLHPLINGLTALAQCLNWFNPLVHFAADTMRVDQELACDAAVMAKFPNTRRRYAEAILKTQIAPLNLPLGCYWPAGGARQLKHRIAMLKRELPGRRRAAAGAVLAALACLSTGCVIWVAQPPREVEALASSVSPEQATLNARLLRAIWWGDVRGVEAAIASGADVNARTADGATALVIVARADDIRNVNLLLKHGADPNLTSPGEGNALVAAARRGQVRSVAALVEHGAQVNTMAPGYGTPLASSVRTGQLQSVKYLVEHGADVNLASPPPAPWDRWGGMRKPLDWAIRGDHASIAAYLKSRGAEM